LKKPKIGSLKVPQVDLYFQKESKWENADKESMGLCNWVKERIYTKKEGVFVIKRRERRSIQVSRSLTMDFIFIFLYFLFLEQLGLGFISHAVISVTSWWQSHKTDHETWENRVEGSGIKWCHTTWTTYVSLMSYTWSLG